IEKRRKSDTFLVLAFANALHVYVVLHTTSISFAILRVGVDLLLLKKQYEYELICASEGIILKILENRKIRVQGDGREDDDFVCTHNIQYEQKLKFESQHLDS
ncbi:hypothetical protein ACJX0J_010268, partial [Zea mays]